jgi:hypothetical protein
MVPPTGCPRLFTLDRVSQLTRRLTRPLRHWWLATPNSHVITAVLSVVLIVAVIGGTLYEVH